MRAYLVDWLYELHMKFKLLPETLYVTIGIIDKYLQLHPDFPKKKIQLLGVTSIHIAGKYEEIYPPELKHYIRVTDNALLKEDILKLEYDILKRLEFNLTWPSVFRFMERFTRIS